MTMRVYAQEGMFGSGSVFQCTSAQVLQTALLSLHSATPPHLAVRLRDVDAANSPRSRSIKRIAPESPRTAAQSGKRKKSGLSRLGLDTLLDPNPESQRSKATCPVQRQSMVGRDQPAGTERPVPRRVVPLQVECTLRTTASKHSTTGTSQAATRRVTPELVQTCHTDRVRNSSSVMSQQAGEEEVQQPRLAGRCLHRQALDSDVSGLGQELGADEGPEGSDEEGSEGVEPSKLLVEFGTASDAWWNDFIAAKEEMLTEVLQVTADIPHDWDGDGVCACF